MKNAKKLFTLFLFTIVCFSCTPETDIFDDANQEEEIYSTDENTTSKMDDNKDPDGD